MRNKRKKSRGLRSAFTLTEIMISMMIFAMVATAGTYMLSATTSAVQSLFRDGTTSQSEVEFALGRMVENVRAATVVSSPNSTTAATTLTLTNISGSTVTYAISNYCLTEKIGSGTANTVVHGTSVHPVSFSVAEYSASQPKAFTITLSAGSDQNISRTNITVLGRNL